MSEKVARRRYTRRAIAVEFLLHERRDSQSGELAFDAVDISEGGAFLRSEFLLDIGEELEVRFRLPGDEGEHVASARVAWVTRGREDRQEPGMGLQFINLDVRTRAAIASFVKPKR